MASIDVLIPTYGRKTGLAVVLGGLLAQTFKDFDLIIADQTEPEACYLDSPEIATLLRALQRHGHRVEVFHNEPRLGMAQQRHVLLERSRAPYVHYLDDDILIDPPVMARMINVLRAEGCGFVGCAATGLEYLDDVRPQEQDIELWRGPVTPEDFRPDSIPWNRHLVNNAANPLHLAARLAPDGRPVRYKVAWIGGANVLYDRVKLRQVGGFSWWPRLQGEYAGEEVVVQFLLIRYFGGCGVLPSDTYHLGLPTTVVDRQRNATALFAELIDELERSPVIRGRDSSKSPRALEESWSLG